MVNEQIVRGYSQCSRAIPLKHQETSTVSTGFFRPKDRIWSFKFKVYSTGTSLSFGGELRNLLRSLVNSHGNGKCTAWRWYDSYVLFTWWFSSLLCCFRGGYGHCQSFSILLSLKLHGCCWGSAVNKAQRNCEELSNLRTATAQRRSNFHPAAFG